MAAVRVFSAAEDPEAAEACARTVGLGFASEPNNAVLCAAPELYGERWYGIAKNSLLRSPEVPMLHTVVGHDRAAVAFAYSYPEHKAPDDAPEPPGTVDLSASSRPGSDVVRDDFLSYMAAKKADFLAAHGAFEYLAFLATQPLSQGQGLGSRLVRHIIDRADAAGRWCYLEATNADNVRLYARHGFQQLEAREWALESVPGKRFTLILMARPPAAAADPARADAGAGGGVA